MAYICDDPHPLYHSSSTLHTLDACLAHVLQHVLSIHPIHPPSLSLRLVLAGRTGGPRLREQILKARWRRQFEEDKVRQQRVLQRMRRRSQMYCAMSLSVRSLHFHHPFLLASVGRIYPTTHLRPVLREREISDEGVMKRNDQ